MKTFITSFLENVREYADNKAVADAKGCYTYRELDEKSNLVAAEIIKRAKTLGKDIVKDIEAGKNGLRVGVLFPRVKDFMVAVIGVMRAGCTFIPIDDSYPIERIRSIVEDSGCSFIVTTSDAQEKHELLSGLKLKSDQYILIEGLKSETGVVNSYNLARYDNEGAIYYTSGSTGKPKGVIHNHKVFSCCDYMGHSAYGMSAGETCACMAGFTFLASIIDLITPFYCGGCVYIINESEFTDLPKLHSLILENKIQYMYMPPKLAVSFFDIYKDVSMKKIICAGEKLSKRPSTDAEVLEYYGSTEDFLVLGHRVDKDENPGLLGKPTTKCRMYLVDDNNQQITQPGVSGELCAVSEYLALGYNNDPEKTAEKFVPCPFEENSVMFRSGDLMSLTDDGSFKFHGRKDNMVKLNGYRVELEGVEAVIAKSDTVKEAACAMVTVDGKTVLGCYYVEEENCNNFSLEALKKHAARFMPYYMVPSVFMQLDRLPRNKNGKLDRKALPEFKLTAGEKVPPATENEKKLFELACGALNTDNFGVTTNLVSMGLNSLAAMRFCAEIQGKMSVAVRSTDIMQCQNIRVLAQFLEQQKDSTSELKKYALQEYYPITENQRGIYLEWERDHASLQYNLPRVYKFTDKNAEQLAEAVCKAVDIHSYLKTRIVELNGEIVQKPFWDEKPEVKVQSLDSMPDSDFFQKLVKPFNLLKDRLYRIEIFKSSEAVYLFTDFYHIIFDGLSYANFIRDVLAAYDGMEISPEKLTACDFALYEAENAEKEAYNKARDYFDSLMADANTAKYLDSAEPDGKNFGRQQVSVLSEAIDRFCSENAVTVSSFLHSVFAETLYRLTREENPFYATVSNGRSASSELLNSTGMFVKTLPVVLRTDGVKHGDETPAGYIKRMHQQLQTTYSNEFYPYTKIAERSGLQAKALFVYQGGVLDDNGLEQLELGDEAAVFPLDIFAYSDSKGGYLFDIKYDANIYSSRDIKQLADVIAVVAKGMTSARFVKQISLIDDEQTEAVLRLSKGETIDYDRSQTWIDLFRKQAAAHPDKLAVVDDTGSLTYAELNRQSDMIAAYLVKNGVELDDFVALKIDRVKEFVVAATGIQKAGAGYIPVALEYPEERKAYMLENSQAKVVLTEELIKSIVADSSETEFECRTSPDRHAYMIYTSGSTGRPKGVRLHQCGLLNYVYSMSRVIGIKESDRISAHRAFSFDSHIGDFYPTLCAGATVYIMPERIRKDLDAIYEFLNKHDITAGGYSTLIGKMLVQNYSLKQRLITLAGEALNDVTSDRTQIINMYGPTECTDIVSTYWLEKGKHYDSALSGRPMANGYCFIVDKFGNLVPQGVAGELCYAGPQVSYGYWRLEEKTKEVFGDCPFVKGLRMYHTGDLCKYRPDGEIQYLGRIDNQVKLRGFRIELGEIDAQAAQLKGIGLCSAQIRNEQICLYYTSEDGRKLDKEAMRSSLAESLAEFMVPTVFMQLENMPMTPSGKIDRKSLPEPEIEATEIVAPETEREKQLFDVVSEILGSEKISVTANLVSLGLNSLAAMRLSAAVKQKLGLPLKVADIMKLQTIRAIAANLEKGEDSGIALKAYEKRELYPITENQRGIYVAWEMNRNTTQYNIPSVYRFEDKDAEKLAEAVRKAIDAHCYLKTRFVNENGDVMQKPMWNEPAEVTVQTLDKEPDADFFQKLVKPFNLFEDRLYRIAVYKATKAAYLFMDIHHTVFDGLSFDVILRDILAAYDGKVPEPEKITALDFALYEKEVAASEMFNKAEAYFEKLTGDSNTVVYPDAKKADGIKNGKVAVKLPMEAIDRFCLENGVTVNAYMHAAFAEILHRFTREENPLYLTISNGRSDAEALQNSVGMFVKTLPVVMQTEGMKHGDETIAGYVKRMYQQLQDTYALDFYPYTRIVEKSGIHAEIMFIYQGGIEGYSSDDINSIQLNLDTGKFPVDVKVYPESGKYCLTVEYDGNRYEQRYMRQFAEAIATVAENMASEKLVKNIKLLDKDDIESVLKLSAGEKLEYDKSQTWIDLFKKQVAAHPEKQAVVDVTSSLTYAELDRQSDIIAAYLVKNGVKPDDFVALKIDRVKEFVVAAFAVQKAGAGYVPIALEYPEDRKEYIRENSEASVVLTEQNIKDIISENDYVPFECRMSPDRHAYMIYTSGSTGRPKGVRLHQRGLLNYVYSINRILGISENDRIGCHKSFSFDAHIGDIYPVLCAGATVCLMPERIRKDLDGIYSFLKDFEITACWFTTPIASLLLKNYDLSFLRYLAASGEAFRDVGSDSLQLFNLYGPTECTDISTTFRMKKGEHYDIAPIGRPMPNSYGFIVDAYGNLLPQGIAGELCYAGPQVGYGYWRLDEKTKEVFGDCPFISDIRMYHTGDLCRYNADGDIEYLSRIDNQVKLRGFRIELGEIEARAAQYENIALSAVQIRKEQICMYYTSDDGSQLDKNAIRSYMAESLAEFMVPTVFIQLDKMPMTPSGKINRKALPDPVVEREKGREPATELESKLCDIFAEILGTNKVYADENFFNIGGTSISAMKVVMKAMNNGIKFVYSNIFDNPTPEALARFIENGTEGKTVSGHGSDEIYAPKEEFCSEALKYNTMEYLEDVSGSDIGKVLVTGANGFLGIHVVKKLIDNGCPVVYCLIRNGKNMSAETRLDMMFMYYFDETYSEMIGDRIRIINGDITDKGLEAVLEDVDYDTVINCAALVKHFSNDDILDRVNFHGVENLVEICCKHNKKLVQVSTVSTAGESVDNAFPQTFQMHENQLSFGQNLENKYGRTKWQAEKAVLEAVQNRGLRGKVIRVGNLMSRASDGEFQANFRTNNFMNTLRAYNTLNCLPMDNIVKPTEFSPIDSTAEAVITLAGTPDKFTVFHAYNNHTVDMANVIDAMNACGLDIKIVKQSEFQKRFDEVMHDEKLNASISSLIAYLGNNSSRWFISCNNTFTLAALNVLGFRWPIITEKYIEKAIKALKSMDFFE